MNSFVDKIASAFSSGRAFKVGRVNAEKITRNYILVKSYDKPLLLLNIVDKVIVAEGIKKGETTSSLRHMKAVTEAAYSSGFTKRAATELELAKALEYLSHRERCMLAVI